MLKTGLTLFLTVVVSLSVHGEDLTSLIAKPLNYEGTQNLITSFDDGEAIESFIPFNRIYKLTYMGEGIEMEFNADMALVQINLYANGSNFKAYEQDLPFGAVWGMDSIRLQELTGILRQEDNNPFMKFMQTNQYTMKFFFKDYRLEHIRIVVDPSFLQTKRRECLQAWGVRLFPDGQVISGNVVDGEGQMNWGKVGQYKGDWLYGLPHGVGEYKDSFGNIYAGEFKLGFFWGAGSYTSLSYQYRYDGMYIMGRRQGKGYIQYDDGRSYNGIWYLDMMHGEGTYVFTKDYFYQGEMFNNQIEGKGVLTTPDGYVKGRFKSGKPHGYCEQYSVQSKQKLTGYWQHGLKQGEFTISTFGYERKIHFKDDVEVFPSAD